MAGEELDPLFRGPPPGQEPGDYGPARSRYMTPFDIYARQESDRLDQLAAARYRQRTGPYAYGRNLYELAQRERNKPPGTSYSDYLTRTDAELIRRAEVAAQNDAIDNALRDSIREAERLRNEEIKAQTRAAQARVRELAQASRTLRAASLPVVAGAGNQLVSIYADIWLRQRAIRERRKRILAVGRRGAAATRPLSTTAIPGRTGAKSTRAIEPVRAPSTTSSSTPNAGKSGSGSKPNGTASGTAAQLPTPSTPVIGESEASKEARRVMSETPTLPTRTKQQAASASTTLPRVRLSVRLSELIPVQIPGIRNLLAPRAVPRARARAGARADLPTLAQMPQSLTALESQGVGSSPPGCKCPKPEKPKRKQFACSNPIISRSVKDGIITIKRKLLCQPSKPK